MRSASGSPLDGSPNRRSPPTALTAGYSINDELAVTPDAQDHGIGAQLLHTILTTPPEQRAWLLTWTRSPAAIRFYQRQGWHQLPTTATGTGTDQVVVFLAPNHPAAIKDR